MPTPQLQYEYETIADDPFQVHLHTLSNGLKLYLSVNPTEPRIFTNIAVRAGSKHDPADTTGLAHYMEHMLFKGTSRIGALDWEREAPLLEQIADLYEQHRATEDEAERRRIYREIDRLSFEASQLVAPNEYDMLATAIGAAATNAYTWVEQTVYVNDIPANELERWMQLEAERFRMLALRLFHTELETVYEEFNISQDRDARKVSNTLRRLLFPAHPYGTQTTLGSAQHLKNPSQRRIQEFFRTYYVPNNMAILMAGDFDPDEVVALAERYFGGYRPAEPPPFRFDPQPDFDQPQRQEVFGQESPSVELAWRLNGKHSPDPLMVGLLQGILYNGQAGLLDLHLNQTQRILDSEAWHWLYEDFSVLGLYGQPREGQSLEAVERLLLAEVERLKAGDFEDWLLEAVVREEKLEELKALENNKSRVSAMTFTFIMGMPWEDFVGRIEKLERITKEEVVGFARRHLGNNYAAVYKQQGPDPHLIKVEKPPITPIELKREALSDFARSFLAQSSSSLSPEFVNFDEHIRTLPIRGDLRLDYVHNPYNPTFRLDYIFEMGKNHDRELALAMIYLPYLGTSRYSPSRLQQEFYRLGLGFNVFSNDQRTFLTLSGLEESLEEGIRLFEHLLAEVQEDTVAWRNIAADIITKRANAKQERNFVLREAMAGYARYGAESPFAWRLPAEALTALDPGRLIERIRTLCRHEHAIYYYGQQDPEKVAGLLRRHHRAPDKLTPLHPERTFTQLPTEENQVYFLDFPIVQTDLLLISRGTPYFNLEEHLMRELYNEYFGYGLSSIVFQEIREAKGLAYSTYALYTSPRQRKKAHYLQAYVGTQPDKATQALPAMLDIIENMPLIPDLVGHARTSILKRLESRRLLPSRIYWEARALRAVGIERDLNRDLYEHLQSWQPADLAAFHEKYVRDRRFNLLVLGSRDQLDLDYLRGFGAFKELQLEDVFGY